MKDSRKQGELEHLYGENYHILNDPFLISELGKLCQMQTKQPTVNNLVRDLYTHMIREVINNEFPTKQASITTRMAEYDSQGRGHCKCEIVDPDTKAVIIDVMRAGILPSQVCFETLSEIINPDNVRQDHVIMARTTNEKGEVTGAHFGESKIGGDIDKSIVLFPDPMGATGSSLAKAVTYFKNEIEGQAVKFITMNLIVTPEYLQKMKETHPDVIVYAVRLDRGASSDEIQATVPGTNWDEESGLNEMQYIIPGGGGFGEIMNNSYC